MSVAASRVRLPEPEVLIGLVVEVVNVPAVWNIEAPGEVLVKPAPAPKVMNCDGVETSKEVPAKVELLVKVPLKVTSCTELIIRGFAELLVTVLLKVIKVPIKDAGPELVPKVMVENPAKVLTDAMA